MPSLISGYRQRSRISCVAVLARRDSEPSGGRAQDRDRLRVVVPRAVTRLVAVVAVAGLLPEAPGLVAARRRPDSRSDRADNGSAFARCTLTPTSMPAMSKTREDAHRHPPVLEHRVDAPRRRALEHDALRLARVAFHHPVADESVADAREHGRLAQRLRELHRRQDRLRRRLRRAHHLEQRHHVRRREEVQADHVLGPLSRLSRSRRCRASRCWSPARRPASRPRRAARRPPS